MIEGLLRQDTGAEIDRNCTDTHGASIVGFAMTHLLGFKRMPTLKNIGSAKLYRAAAGIDERWPQVGPVLSGRSCPDCQECAGTHVVLPGQLRPFRADSTEVIGQALACHALGARV